MESIKDPSIKIIPSARLFSVIKNLEVSDDEIMPKSVTDLRELHNIESNEKEAGEESSFTVLFSVKDVEWVLEKLQKSDKHVENLGMNHDLCLHSLLEECKVVLPMPKPIKRNPVLEERVKRLRLEQDERDYRRMTRNVDVSRKHEPRETISYQLQQINRQLIAVFQFVVSVITGFVFGFLGIELMVGSLDFGFRLLLGIICALIIALAEIYFLAKKLSEDIFPPEKYKLHQD
ncbi:transmembrane protein 199 [Ischnura elegans]|uniref:transmembrane protein 199 n=1 Tax=Ischnura elegans TaxID=197161 RepID=UPI001ED8B411|nr:transmembrane protein 199 [Ischnura elegans]